MGETQLISLLIQGGFTALAGFLVWRMAVAAEQERLNAQEREKRMASRIDALEKELLLVAKEQIRSQTEYSEAMRENSRVLLDLSNALRERPCIIRGAKKDAEG